MQVDVHCFDKPNPENVKRQRAEMLQALRKIVVVPVEPIRTAIKFLSAYGQREAYRVDMSAVTDEAALDTAAALADWIQDCDNIWGECYMTQRVEYAREFIQLCMQIKELGYFCYIGSHRQQLRQKDGSRLIFKVGVMTILRREGADATRYAMIQLEGAWESMEEDRVPLSNLEAD